jgi:Uma2 family endonuclease
LENLVPDGWFVGLQEPLTTQNSEPEPDLFIVRGTSRDYANRHPEPEDVALVVEVSDATLERDRKSKKRIYAAAGIPVYWVVNLREKCIEVYTSPSGSDYENIKRIDRKATAIVFIDNDEVGQVAVSDVLP